MKILKYAYVKKAKNAIANVIAGLRDLGFVGFTIYVFEDKTGIRVPLNSKLRWKTAVKSEVSFWNDYFETKGLEKPQDYNARLDPTFPLQEAVVKLLPQNKSQVEILDVGAGPLTRLGKVHEGLKINITAVDPLARRIRQSYEEILCFSTNSNEEI